MQWLGRLMLEVMFEEMLYCLDVSLKMEKETFSFEEIYFVSMVILIDPLISWRDWNRMKITLVDDQRYCLLMR